MQQFDTITLAIPKKAIKCINEPKFNLDQRTNCFTGLTSGKYQLMSENQPEGISKLTWNTEQDMLLTYSAKVLGDDYLTGITKENWFRGIEAVSDIIQVDTDMIYNEAFIHRADSTNNIWLKDIGTDQKTICTSLLVARSNDRFKEYSYLQKKSELAIEFRGTQNEKNRMIIYAKHLDLIQAKNKDFMRSLNNPSKMYDEAEKQLRFEVNHTAWRSLRNRFITQDHSLKNLLNSTAPVNYNFLKKILSVKDVKQTNLFDEYKSFNNDAIAFIQYKGLQAIIRDLNYNDQTIKQFFRTMFADENTFKYHWYNKKKNKKKHSIKQIMESMNSERFKIDTSYTDTISNKVLHQLQKAVA
jgi:hypothetical protein